MTCQLSVKSLNDDIGFKEVNVRLRKFLVLIVALIILSMATGSTAVIFRSKKGKVAIKNPKMGSASAAKTKMNSGKFQKLGQNQVAKAPSPKKNNSAATKKKVSSPATNKKAPPLQRRWPPQEI
eukprot:GHVT01086764.1.p1 GENE.GHVT01086764.1~~GHVT01086764.1.p1  ORF type:complete len:124 (-),score=14.27 GHVT01086764.1:809-1180(-)